MLGLGVNIDHVATVRQARRTVEPDPIWAAAEAELGGADGITFHLREDRRHIQDRDAVLLAETVTAKVRLGMAIYSAKVIDQASRSYNNGLRAYYFSMAVLSWFISPWLFFMATALVTAILYQREFLSKSLQAMKMAENVGEKIFNDDKDLYRQ